jgi:threonine dehydrogenase-like Zn-dependent dehydrogenase
MKALVYKGDGGYAVEERPDPKIIDPTDAVVKSMYRSCNNFQKAPNDE